jgi:hypothetical protein
LRSSVLGDRFQVLSMQRLARIVTVPPGGKSAMASGGTIRPREFWH